MQKLYKIVPALGWMLIAVVISSCRMQDAKSPEEWFKDTWSGLAGVDTLTFHGKAALWRGENGELEQNLSYTGQMDDHHQLTIRTVIAEGEQKGRLQTSGQRKDEVHEAKLQALNRHWHIVSDPETLGSGLARLNPLEQLEQIQKANKTIKMESGAARGTRVLRIELDSKDALHLMAAGLEEEMNQIREKWDGELAKLPSTKRGKVSSQAEQIYSYGKEQLAQMLNQADIHAVYHLTIDRKTGLPLRLTSESRLAYLSPQGAAQQEMLRTDNRFTNYK